MRAWTDVSEERSVACLWIVPFITHADAATAVVRVRHVVGISAAASHGTPRLVGRGVAITVLHAGRASDAAARVFAADAQKNILTDSRRAAAGA